MRYLITMLVFLGACATQDFRTEIDQIERDFRTGSVCSLIRDTEVYETALPYPVFQSMYALYLEGLKLGKYHDLIPALAFPEGVDWRKYATSNDKTVRFYSALGLAGLLNYPAAEAKKEDLEEALRILSQLENEDKNNGAFPMYRAYILHSLEAPRDKVKRAMFTAFRAKHFNMFDKDMIHHLMKDAYRSEKVFTLFVVLSARINHPDIVDLIEIAREVYAPGLEGHKDERLAMLEFAKRLMRKNIQYSHYSEIYFWNSLEYMFAYHLGRLAYRGLYPEKDYPAYLKRAYSHYYDQEEHIKWHNVYVRLSQAQPGQCDAKELTQRIKREKEVFKRYQKGQLKKRNITF